MSRGGDIYASTTRVR